MRKILALCIAAYAYFYLSKQGVVPTIDQIKNMINLNENPSAQQTVPITQQETKESTAMSSGNNQQPSSTSIPASYDKKYTPTKIQTYWASINNGKLVVTGKETVYGQYTNANGVILYIDEPRANKKTTIKVPFTNGTIHYEFPLTYSVGDVILNLNEYYNGKADDPNKVLGYAEYHLTNGDPYLQPSYMVQSNNPTLVNLAKKITAGKQTDTEKSRAIFEWVAKNIAYNAQLVNSPNPPLYSALTTYENRVVLCSGYADLSAALHRAIGIEAKVDYGENHAWNEIKLNGVWQTEDPTYASGFINLNTGKFVRSYHPAYFYKSDKHKEGEYPW
ncbi:transglutaminase domain-containing protein [Bacillus sp. BRMEA1]|uniref:transglutaminase domain-containing protein n=1 Tax=Neobacillus endophyticus TaxID=2738405 RepID=UPI0015677094|nr:transglutaminase-like domain-containing protein [Neobacillus endophyticus]NRD79503.1 transglutaminase domain-containing protein [Neobacillus endophyticus]